MKPLKVIAVASSEESRNLLAKQLQALDFVAFEGVVIELSDAEALWEKEKPDLLIIDLTGREYDACLFIEVINYNVESKTVVFGLHRDLDPNVIVKAVSSGVKEFIQYPQDPDALTAAINKHWNFYQKLAKRQHALSEPEQREGKLIPVFGSKGGVGASTVAVNLGESLHRATKESVVVFDMDQVFRNIAVMLQIKADHAVSDLVAENAAEIDDDLLAKIIVHHPTGMDVVVACKSVLDDNPLISPELLERVIAYLKSHYSYVIVDLPSHVIDNYHQYFMEVADEVMLVSTLDIPGLSRTRQYLDLIREHLDMSKIKLILNRHDLKAVIGMSNENIEKEFGYPVYSRLPNNWALTVEASSLGQTLGQVSTSADLSKAFYELACQIAGIDANQSSSKTPSGNKMPGLFQRFRRTSA